MNATHRELAQILEFRQLVGKTNALFDPGFDVELAEKFRQEINESIALLRFVGFSVRQICKALEFYSSAEERSYSKSRSSKGINNYERNRQSA